MCARTLLLAIGLVAFVSPGFLPAVAAAQSPWSVQFGGEQSAVTNKGVSTTWSQQLLTLGFVRESEGGWRAVAERQERSGVANYVFTTGGYRRLGDWTIGGSVAASPDASFWFERAFDVELSRRIVGTLVASGAYRYMGFPAVTIHQVQPALTYYHSRGEVEARVFVTRNATRESTSLSLLLRTALRVNTRLELSGAVAFGDRIFDIASLAYGNANAWTARAGLRVFVSKRNELAIGGGMAREAPSFEQRTVIFGYRRLF